MGGGAIDVDDLLGRHAVGEQLLGGAGVGDVHHLLGVLVPLHKPFDILLVNAELLRKRFVVAHRRCAKEAHQELRCERSPSEAIPAAK